MKMTKRKGFKTSPSIRIPRRAAENMQAAAAAAADRDVLRAALVDAVAFIDRFRNTEGSWTVADVKRLEAIRLLSLF
jgi:hypothetical protein